MFFVGGGARSLVEVVFGAAFSAGAAIAAPVIRRLVLLLRRVPSDIIAPVAIKRLLFTCKNRSLVLKRGRVGGGLRDFWLGNVIPAELERADQGCKPRKHALGELLRLEVLLEG